MFESRTHHTGKPPLRLFIPNSSLHLDEYFNFMFLLFGGQRQLNNSYFKLCGSMCGCGHVSVGARGGLKRASDAPKIGLRTTCELPAISVLGTKIKLLSL